MYYDQAGSPLSDVQFGLLLESLNERHRQYGEAVNATPPDPARPIPLQLEHTSKIVGWARVSANDEGLFVDEAYVTDDNTMQRIKLGELKGFSIAGLVPSSECSICQGEYVDCNHIAGRSYDGQECTVRIKIDPAELSVVKEPINPGAVLNIKDQSNQHG